MALVAFMLRVSAAAAAADEFSRCVKMAMLPSERLFDLAFADVFQSSTFWNQTFTAKPSISGTTDVDHSFSMEALFAYLNGLPRIREDFVHHGDGWRLVKRAFRDGDWWSSAPRTGPIHLGLAVDLFRKRGYSFVFDRAQEWHPPFKRWTDTLEDALGHRVNANLYVTPNDGTGNQAFEKHFDYMDGAVIQIAGCKFWRVARDASTQKPIADTVFKCPLDNAMEDIPREMEVRPGTMLYLPRGWAHEAALNCTQVKGLQRADEDTVSVHVTLGMEVAGDSTVEVALHHLVDQLFGSPPDVSGSTVDVAIDGDAHAAGDGAVTAVDWLHLLVHAAATVDPAAPQPRAWDRDVDVDGAVLRTAVAVTSFAASSGAYATWPTLTADTAAYLEAFQAAVFTPTLGAMAVAALRETLASEQVGYVHRFLTPAATAAAATGGTGGEADGTLSDDGELSSTLHTMWQKLVAAVRLDNDGPAPLCAAWQRMTDTLRAQREARLAVE